MLDTEVGRASVLAMHPTPAGNFSKFANGFLALDLEWNRDFLHEPHYPPGMGSLRLESRYSVHRDKTDSFGMLEMSSKHLTDLAVATSIASGSVRAPTSAKGYQSHEERVMQPTSYVSTPRPVLQTVMLRSDRVTRLLFEKKLAIDSTGAKLVATSSEVSMAMPTPAAGPSGTAAALLKDALADLDDAEMLGTDADAETAEVLEVSLEKLQAATEGANVVELQSQQERRLQESMKAVAAVVVSRSSGEAEDVEEHELSEVVGVPARLEATPLEAPVRGGAGAVKECTTQREETESKWLTQLEVAIRDCPDSEGFSRRLIAMRQQTAAVAKTKAGQRVRTSDEQQVALAAQAESKNRTVLKCDDGRVIDPASLLRELRLKGGQSLLAFRKQGRLARWMSGSTNAASHTSFSLASDGATIQAGEVWLVLMGPSLVIPCVVYGAYARIKGGLRPESDPKQPHELQNSEAIELQLYGAVVTSDDEGNTFRATGHDLLRTPRQMLSRLACSSGPFDAVDVSACRSQQLLRLHAPACLQLKAFQDDPQMGQLWEKLRGNTSTNTSAESPHLQEAAVAVATAAAKVARKPRRQNNVLVAPTSSAPAPAAPRFNLKNIIGMSAKKHFHGHGDFIGKITAVSEERWYTIVYDDGDKEEVTRNNQIL